MRKAVFSRLKNHLFATDFRKPQIRHSFSFNSKICVPIRIDEVLDSVFCHEGCHEKRDFCHNRDKSTL